MKDNYTDIYVVLDCSGSMAPVVNDTIGGFNAFLSEQKNNRGEATISLIKFNANVETVWECQPLSDADDLTTRSYRAGGGTALFDAIGQTINMAGNRLAALEENDRPSKVIFVIITDGEENSSRTFTDQEQIASMITHQRELYSWEFIFLGANQDAFTTAGGLGINSNRTMTYAHSNIGTQQMFQSVSRGMTSYRAASGTLDASVDYFASEDRQAQEQLLDNSVASADDAEGHTDTDLVI